MHILWSSKLWVDLSVFIIGADRASRQRIATHGTQNTTDTTIRRMHNILRVRFAPGAAAGSVPDSDCDEERLRWTTTVESQLATIAMRDASWTPREAVEVCAYRSCFWRLLLASNVPHATCHRLHTRDQLATTLLASTAKAEANTKHTRGMRHNKSSVCKAFLLRQPEDSLSCVRSLYRSLCCAGAVGEQLLEQLDSCCSSSMFMFWLRCCVRFAFVSFRICCCLCSCSTWRRLRSVQKATTDGAEQSMLWMKPAMVCGTGNGRS